MRVLLRSSQEMVRFGCFGHAIKKGTRVRIPDSPAAVSRPSAV